MDILFTITTLSFGVLVAITVNKASQRNSGVKITGLYDFQLRNKVMTTAEGHFFASLNEVVGERFFIIAQAHLSTFIDHRVKGQNWKAAFSVINGKSVDFLLVEKTSLKPVAAIELDDWSHKREDRIARDERVAAILKEAGILLVRFDNPNTPPQEIVDKIYTAVNKTTQQQ